MRGALAVVAAAAAMATAASTVSAAPLQKPAAVLGQAFAAYERGDVAAAARALGGVDDRALVNRDYATWLRGMVALRNGNISDAEQYFRKLETFANSRFAPEVPWRLADCAWARGDRGAAATAYAALIAVPAKAAATERPPTAAGDVGTAMYRIALARDTATAWRALVVAHPEHPLAAVAEANLRAAGGPPLTPAERIARSQALVNVHEWDEAVAELQQIAGDAPPDVANQRDYWLGMTLFKMRRRYADAGTLLLAVAPKLADADVAADAMFHGARALSRADRDDEAITWYRRVVAQYPASPDAPEAQYLAGWLELNRGHYREAIAPLEVELAKYGHSKFAPDARWFLALSHYMLGEWAAARTRLVELQATPGALEAGKASYWLARIDDRLGKRADAERGYRETVRAYPMSWYALLSRARLAAAGIDEPPFGATKRAPRGPALAATVDESLATDPLIARADELLAAGMPRDAGAELERGEKAFLTHHDRGAAFAIMLDRYRAAGDAFRPWMLAVSYAGAALEGPAQGDAERWWQAAYPRAFRELVEKYQGLGDNPDDYLYSIMRKESGFNPHDISYADAQGLLQMIPPTTRRVAAAIGEPYDDGKLYEPAYNIEVGSWYIGHLLRKFDKQIPIGAGAFNCGPKPVMKWLDQFGDREIDEWVELVPYTQTREYMKKVTENYARYQYLYEHAIYVQPLAVERRYADDQLVY